MLTDEVILLPHTSYKYIYAYVREGKNQLDPVHVIFDIVKYNRKKFYAELRPKLAEVRLHNDVEVEEAINAFHKNFREYALKPIKELFEGGEKEGEEIMLSELPVKVTEFIAGEGAGCYRENKGPSRREEGKLRITDERQRRRGQ
jgi:hypothetical protein